jgi:hypothetical protein
MSNKFPLSAFLFIFPPQGLKYQQSLVYTVNFVAVIHLLRNPIWTFKDSGRCLLQWASDSIENCQLFHFWFPSTPENDTEIFLFVADHISMSLFDSLASRLRYFLFEMLRLSFWFFKVFSLLPAAADI